MQRNSGAMKKQKSFRSKSANAAATAAAGVGVGLNRAHSGQRLPPMGLLASLGEREMANMSLNGGAGVGTGGGIGIGMGMGSSSSSKRLAAAFDAGGASGLGYGGIALGAGAGAGAGFGAGSGGADTHASFTTMGVTMPVSFSSRSIHSAPAVSRSENFALPPLGSSTLTPTVKGKSAKEKHYFSLSDDRG
jgi:hypothetical protein